VALVEIIPDNLGITQQDSSQKLEKSGIDRKIIIVLGFATALLIILIVLNLWV
jgi:hypothetical protein